eukprot:Selendium_serpulae@DN11056_c0_g1_i1.p1
MKRTAIAFFGLLALVDARVNDLLAVRLQNSDVQSAKTTEEDLRGPGTPDTKLPTGTSIATTTTTVPTSDDSGADLLKKLLNKLEKEFNLQSAKNTELAADLRGPGTSDTKLPTGTSIATTTTTVPTSDDSGADLLKKLLNKLEKEFNLQSAKNTELAADLRGPGTSDTKLPTG